MDVLRRKIGFWVKHGVLMEKLDRTGNSHSYTRTTHLAAADLGNEAATIAMDEDEGESALVSQEEQLKQVSPHILWLSCIQVRELGSSPKDVGFSAAYVLALKSCQRGLQRIVALI